MSNSSLFAKPAMRRLKLLVVSRLGQVTQVRERGTLPRMSIRQTSWLIGVIALVSIIFGAIVVLDIVPILRGDYADWRWSQEAPEPARLIPLALAVAAYLAGLVIWWRVWRIADLSPDDVDRLQRYRQAWTCVKGEE